jgi:hypothetical protein
MLYKSATQKAMAMGTIMCGFFRTLHDMLRRVHKMYPHIENFGLFGQFWLYFGFFEIFWISCSLHRPGGTYRVHKSDVDDSVEGTEKAMLCPYMMGPYVMSCKQDIWTVDREKT